MNIKGTLTEKFDMQQITDTFRKREFVVEYAENPDYPQLIKFQLVQDKCDMLHDYETGQDIEVSFNLRGRKWESPAGEIKYFNTLEAWRVKGAENSTTVEAAEIFTTEQIPGTDDMPF